MAKNKKDLFSLEIERTCLSSLLQFPEIIPDYASFIKPNMYSSVHHEAICSMIYNMFQETNSLDKTILIERLKNIGLSKISDLSIFDYIDTFSLIPINRDRIRDYFSELVKYYWARNQVRALTEAYNAIQDNLAEPLSKIVGAVEQKIAEAATVTVSDDYQPLDLFGDMVSYLETVGDNPKEIGLITPYPIFNKKYAGLPFGDLYVIAAPPKMGKSTFLGYTSYGCAKLAMNNCKVFYADTELEGHRVLTRIASSLSGVNEYFLKTGKFKSNNSFYNKVKNTVYKEAGSLAGKISHFYVQNDSIDSIMSKFKRWYFTNVKKGENVLFIYDYLKLTGEKTSDHWKEYQIMGEKTDKIKKMVSAYPNVAGLVAVQINRMGDIAMASQIEWFASNIYKMIPKSVDEIQQHGTQFGTHKLIPHRTRIQGEDADGFSNYIKVMEDGEEKTIENYININIDHFKVEEKGTLEDCLNANAGQLLSEPLPDEEDFSGVKYKLNREKDSPILF